MTRGVGAEQKEDERSPEFPPEGHRKAQTATSSSSSSSSSSASSTISSRSELQCECALTQVQVHWLVASSFVVVLSRKQARYHGVLALLRAFRGKRRFASLPGQVHAALTVASVLLKEAIF